MIDGALTANELALLRTRPQRTQLYLAIPEYTAVYTAIKDGTPVNNDNTVTIPFRAPTTGVITDVKLDMMVLISSVGYGLWDAGIARIRKDGQLGDTALSIGITSDIDFADGMFLTVVNDYSLWPRHPWIDPVTEIVYMDYDRPYYSQNTYGAPIPIMGTHAVLELTGATVTTNFDASDTYPVIGTPVTYDYVWTCAGATVVTPLASSTDIVFNAAGTYLVELEVTADFGGSVSTPVTAYSLARRYVVVYDAAHPLNSSFTLDSCSGDYDSGNWSYRITMRDNADEVDIRDRTLCMLVAKDWYGDTQQSIGPIAGRENIVCVGWVDGDSIRRSNDKSSVSFEVQGPAFWLGVQEGFPTGVDDTNAAPTDWVHIENLTTRKGLYHFLRERTTAISIMDCFITDDTHRLPSTYTPAGSLLDQLRAICQKINAKAVCNRYGQLYCVVDTQFIASGFRLAPPLGDFPVAQTLTDRDWREEITIERKAKSPVGQVDLSGVYYSGDFATSTAIFSLAPGHYPRHYGSKHKVERIALSNQSEANLLAGLWLSYLNNEFPTVDVQMSSNYRAIDIAPWSFVQMNLAASDTPRGIAWVNKKLIPRRIGFNYDAGEAVLLTDIEFEAEVEASEAITGDPPIEPPPPPPPPPPPILCNDPLATNFGLPAPCIYITPTVSDIVVVMTGDFLAYSDNAIADPAGANWNNITPAGLADKMMNFCVSSLGEMWIAVTSTVGDLYEGIWYSPNFTTTGFTRILSTATARTESGYNQPAGGMNFKTVCLVNDECYTVLSGDVNYPSPYPMQWWHGTSTLAHESAWMGIDQRIHNIGGRWGMSCTDNINAWVGVGGLFESGGQVVNLINSNAHKFTYGVNGNRMCNIASESYTNAANSQDTSGYLYPYANFDYLINSASASWATPIIEKDGNYFWVRDSDTALMINNSTIQALANTVGGVTGIFSAAGAAGGCMGCINTYGELLWIAASAHGVNSIRDMAMTLDGGLNWVSIDGDWAAAVGPYDGGLVVRYIAITA